MAGAGTAGVGAAVEEAAPGAAEEEEAAPGAVAAEAAFALAMDGRANNNAPAAWDR